MLNEVLIISNYSVLEWNKSVNINKSRIKISERTIVYRGGVPCEINNAKVHIR